MFQKEELSETCRVSLQE